MPSLYGCSDYLVKIPLFAIDALRTDCLFIDIPCDKDFYDLCCIIMEENNFTRSSDPYLTVDLYIKLRNVILPLFQ